VHGYNDSIAYFRNSPSFACNTSASSLLTSNVPAVRAVSLSHNITLVRKHGLADGTACDSGIPNNRRRCSHCNTSEWSSFALR